MKLLEEEKEHWIGKKNNWMDFVVGPDTVAVVVTTFAVKEIVVVVDVVVVRKSDQQEKRKKRKRDEESESWSCSSEKMEREMQRRMGRAEMRRTD